MQRRIWIAVLILGGPLVLSRPLWAQQSQPVTLTNAAGTATLLATDVTEGQPATNGETGPKVMSTRKDVAASSADADGQNANFHTDALGLLWARGLDPCSGLAKTTTPISVTVDTVIISAVSAKKNYICSILLASAAAEIVSITEGTGTVCGTSTAALAGSTTDANGLSSTGFAAIGGSATVIVGKTTNSDICLMLSGSNRVAGWVTFVQAP